jgi:hypothetical protein
VHVVWPNELNPELERDKMFGSLEAFKKTLRQATFNDAAYGFFFILLPAEVGGR